MKQRLSAKDRSDSKDQRTSTESKTQNPHARLNVNVPQGPRTGNEGAHPAKRSNFKDAKSERAPLADQIMRAFGVRQSELEQNPGEHEVPGSGGIDSNSQVRKFRSSKSRYKD
jgi:hypothetical protein